ncbi:MAG: rhomboid family intramembrane serine protease [Hymenobacteraceae bacterium]|nr:rhomboid family intramembrane serine protease [Hymenobacteraceae bacterium]MDX5396976.1 rhomboid family intramembrane serine protease [Hymenobacteraceae bacterium]MDX5442791.1 rhomboid family intramembrane serine protease [Hymenobacteraceae bacterium]MDX5513050.1 rhomboid family intramembrane serine protease [Hymenobacteraceae bacterium]
MKEEDKNMLYNFLPGLLFVGLMWLVFFLMQYSQLNLVQFGLHPGKLSGLVGVVAAPLLHADLQHLLSNSFPIILLSGFILLWLRKQALWVFLWIYIFSGLLAWFIARPTYHIGASGVVYGLASFLFFNGLFRRSQSSMAVSAVIMLLYGGMVYGVFPTEERISWESHLAGGIVGLVLSFFFKQADTDQARVAAQTYHEHLAVPVQGPVVLEQQINKPHPFWPHITSYRYVYVIKPAPPQEEDSLEGNNPDNVTS